MAKQNREIPVQSAYRQRLSEMLDLTYELEGLLHIGIGRSMVPPSLNHLIVNKLNAIVALADEPPAPVEPEVAAPEKENVIDSSRSEDTQESVDISNVITPDSEVPTKQAEVAVEVVDDIVDDEVSDEGYYADDSEEDVMVYAPASPVIESHKDTDVEEAAPRPEYKPAPEPKNPPVSNGRIFSINDRFLYARELFKGRVADFDEAINAIVTMDSPEEAEEYLISEWDVDTENPVASEFIEKIKTIF